MSLEYNISDPTIIVAFLLKIFFFQNIFKRNIVTAQQNRFTLTSLTTLKQWIKKKTILHDPNKTNMASLAHDHSALPSSSYGWNLYQKGWTKCSSICEGLQYKRPVCVDLVTNQVIHSSFCNPDDKESATQKRECNSHCTLTWHTVSKSACSPSCGNG